MISVRHLSRLSRLGLQTSRCMSASSGPLVDVKVNDDTGVATVTLQRLPVNSLNLDFLQSISKTLDELTANKANGVILTSASPTVFSAGLDIMEMYKPDVKRAEAFWRSLQDVWLKLYGSAFPTVAAINGHAPAGGCLLAMSCEYRVMVSGKYKIGLNETALGLIAPSWFMATMRNTIPSRQAEVALTSAKMFTVEEALKVGLIDEVATDKNDCIAKAETFLERFEMIPPKARALTKQSFRAADLNALAKNRDGDVKLFLEVVTNPKLQQAIEMYLQAMKQKSK